MLKFLALSILLSVIPNIICNSFSLDWNIFGILHNDHNAIGLCVMFIFGGFFAIAIDSSK
jgi:hypothetical protein